MEPVKADAPAQHQQTALERLSNSLVGPPPDYNRKELVGHELVQPYEPELPEIPFLWFSSFSSFWTFLISFSIPGMGMFCEAYFIFSIGNIKPLLSQQMPACFKTYTICDKTLTQALDYTQIIGIICGMFLIGICGDRIGRKWGSVMTVSIMFVGCILLACNFVDGFDGGTGFVALYMVAQFIFGFGVGGEYPMAAGSAAERAEAGGPNSARKRGTEVVLTFSNQGVGNFVNVAVLLILLCITGATSLTASQQAVTITWRVAFALGAIPLMFLIWYRIFRLRESAVWKPREAGNFFSDCILLAKYYWPRLLCTAGCWFLWDFSFYGNKVFQSTFIGILSPGATPTVGLLWTLLNSFVALIGYYFSALFIDNPYAGRVRIQFWGFMGVGILFYISAGAYIPLTTPGGIQTFQFIYFLSSFVGQFGPNCTTWLLAGEMYPTELRTTAHGFSAAFAKCGALWGSVWFNYLGSRDKFWATSAVNIAGGVATWIFTPDTMAVSIAEMDRRWIYQKEGKVYHGVAIKPRNLAPFEKWTGASRNFDLALDAADRADDGYTQHAAGNGVTKV